METRLGEVKGYKLVYDTYAKIFRLKDSDGETVGEGLTQDEVERQAEVLRRSAYAFPISALIVGRGGRLEFGRVTSLNIGDWSVRFAWDDKSQGSHRKVDLRYGHSLYEATEANKAIGKQLDAKADEVKRLDAEMALLIKQLEKPIGSERFGLSK